MIKINNELLRNRFRQSDYNYIELADTIDVSRNTIHNIMFGHTDPSYYVLVRVTEALDLTDEDIRAIFFPNMLEKEPQ